MTISIGIAASPQNGKKASEVIEAADKALYQAKDSGRNQVKSSKVLSIVH